MTGTEAVVDKPIQGLHGEDAEGSFYLLLAQILLSREKRKNKRRNIFNEQQKA
jgi:hypothetical protein